MSRTPKPWWRESRSSWFVMLDGKQVNLGPDRKVAHRRFHELMSQPKKRAVASGTVVVVIDRYLDWTKKHRADGTYLWYLNRCQWFVNTLPADLPVDALKPFHVQQWVDAKNCSDGHKRGCMMAVQRAMRWAKRQGYIDNNPIDDMEKPSQGTRETIVTLEEYEALLLRINDQAFRDLIVTSWETGCRPQEILAVEARHVELKNSRWVFPKLEAKGKKKARTVYLTETALEITKRLKLKRPVGKLFRNTKGDPWNPEAVNCRFCRLQQGVGREVMRAKDIDVTDKAVRTYIKRLSPTKNVGGVPVRKSEADLRAEARYKLRCQMAAKHAPKICLYVFRHSFATRMLEAGIDAPVVSAWLGHADLTQLGRTYAHLTKNPMNLLEKLRKAS